MNYQKQTMKRAFAEICQGVDPWIALGNFMNEWFVYSVDDRSQLVSELIHLPEQATPSQLQWAAFCAASVEYLCQKYNVPCPAWPQTLNFKLPIPWYYPAKTQYLIERTPEPFRRRNIYCGDKMFNNKTEIRSPLGI
ncbi:hypothetical protein EI42_05218 [Thermosporothrix hazakensis]|jgi:hypothetical protein|uniref:Uncharacterized protein n=1 Tax=Thermosporothrix hazakensis TaxID=644383 RepID=A0A326U8W5_THEHA|nr:hypothetical protein [Thermosporothrix hazakensis]PZW23005.1 hypothetical protein EI42_05218 [Thermosporothrix hazakensis]GCE48316.1 hypothetical protein KTH_31850 [Thermosporothrix hazakensis]